MVVFDGRHEVPKMVRSRFGVQGSKVTIVRKA
jgi:hypothetical protein